MNSEFKEVYDNFLAASHQERINAARNGVGIVLKYLKGQGADDDFLGAFFGTLLGLFIGSDGKITPNEADIYNQVFGTSYSPQELVEYVSQCTTAENYKILNDIVDSMDEDTKVAACVIVLAIITADGEIDETEAGLFEELWA